jgi:hypothetical protein
MEQPSNCYPPSKIFSKNDSGLSIQQFRLNRQIADKVRVDMSLAEADMSAILLGGRPQLSASIPLYDGLKLRFVAPFLKSEKIIIKKAP